MKRWQVVGVFIVCILVGVAGWASQKAVADYVHPMGSGGQTAGQGWEVENIPLDPALGEHVKIEITSLNGHPLNVYYTTEAGLVATHLGQPFEYDPQYSHMNATHVKMELSLPVSSEILEIMITSSDPQEIVPCQVVAEQSHLPFDMKAFFQATSFICWISGISLFVLLVHSISIYRGERNRYA